MPRNSLPARTGVQFTVSPLRTAVAGGRRGSAGAPRQIRSGGSSGAGLPPVDGLRVPGEHLLDGCFAFTRCEFPRQPELLAVGAPLIGIRPVAPEHQPVLAEQR